MKRILRDYIELAREDHLSFDIRLSLVFGVVVAVFAYFSGVEVKKVLEGLNYSISSIISAFSILAGFNITSLTILATSNSDVAKLLKSEVIENTNTKKIEQILAYFSWSIVVQLVLLFFSIILSLVFTYLLNLNEIFQSTSFLLFCWLIIFTSVVGALYSIILTLRNITILYEYLVADSRKQ